MQTIEPHVLPGGGVLRSATPEDAAHIHNLICELAEFEHEPEAVVTTPGSIAEVLAEEGGPIRCHVVEEAGEIVAIALWYRNFSTWTGNGIWLDDLYVTPSHRKRGYATALIASLAKVCAEKGWRRIEWWALNWNQDAIDVYTRLGAVPMNEWTVFRLEGANVLDTLTETLSSAR